MTIKICKLEAPAKCARVNNHADVPFAYGEECSKCRYQVQAEIVEKVN